MEGSVCMLLASEVLWLETDDLWSELEGMGGESEIRWSVVKVQGYMVRRSCDVSKVRGVVVRRDRDLLVLVVRVVVVGRFSLHVVRIRGFVVRG
ncbi:hypothetical protein F2Q69_00060060 [Brassica cretica]|uniref:Uncharacterized protein n=1 Tax=Brassica cretica TaxID=69181 RepID=A0A8S9RCE5_BRACR|nr:hypothetical protein F2Q69_00060060 [Brassica cretica]